jgi:small subunit ribosomal protein S4
MARYTGPKRRLERREGVSLFGSNKWEKRPGKPGQHPFTRSRPSEFYVQVREKQKVKIIYGLLEKQFRGLVDLALKSESNSGTVLLQSLETRLDNIVFRLGYAKTRMQARQYVTHRHVTVNDKILNIPSYIVKPGDKIGMRTKIAEGDMYKVTSEDLKDYKVPAWLSRDGFTGKLLELPKRTDLDQSISENLIIEFYSR